jgi:alanine racemase
MPATHRPPALAAPDRCWIEVDLAAVVRNARALAAQARKPLLPMVKADAYGLGAMPVVKALESVDPWGYGVATVAEGEELRAAGIGRPILVVTPLPPGPKPLKAVRAAGLTPSLADAHSIRTWMMLGGDAWHLSIDTGMSRAGIRWDAVASLADELRACPPAGAFTHFHSSEADNGTVALQTQRFRDAVAALPATPALLHAENSGAIERTSPSPWSVARPGVFLYGIHNDGPLAPEPVVALRAVVVDIRDVKPGETVSYGAAWTAGRLSRVATLGVGYADGYRRSLGNLGSALVNGARVPVVGTVTMDLTMLDVTDVPCDRGDVATLIGADGDESITVNDVGAACGLSPYEVLTGLRSRAPRVYRHP